MQKASSNALRPQSPDGDRASFETLALSHQSDLYRISLKLTGNAADAEDLVQDVYVRALRYFKNFRQGTNFRAWMSTILRTTFIDERRKQKRRPLCVDPGDLDFCGTPARVHRDAVRATEYGDDDLEGCFDDQVRAALLSLPPDFRRTFLLASVSDFTYDEIGALMSCPGGTVRSRICRSRRLLQKCLRGQRARAS